ncbi:MAG: BCCT family transporter [Deltaproteobacteria bacterium]|jgi:glycine betaine transporter|nr:BCCT family transporter [Deltaproteobacteria bacterium]
MRNFLGSVDRVIFGGTALIYLALFVFIIGVPKTAEAVIKSTLDFTLNRLGWIYLLSFSIILIFLLFLAFSKYGRLKLGPPDSKPEYSLASWVGMLYGAGLGVGLVFFGVNEPMSHFFYPPLADPETARAATDAMRISFFHWGIHPWAMYTATGLAMAYFQHRKGLPGRISSSFEPMLGQKGLNGNLAKIIDIFAMVAILCGVATSVGFAGNQFAAGLAYQYGFSQSTILVAVVIIIISVLSTASALKGVAKGIKIVSDGNMIIVVALIAFALIAGPTMFEFNTFFETMGNYINQLPAMSFFLDANGTVAEKAGYNWVGGWSVMYFAWWVAFAPFVGGFLSDISRGRTIREFILACVFIPSILCFIWFTCYGGSAISMTMGGTIPEPEQMVSNSTASLFIFLKALPIPTLSIIVAMALIITLIVTSVNSATYVMGVMSSGASSSGEPSLGLRGFWGAFMAINALLFLWVGGMQALRNSSMVGALPFMIILLLMLYNMMRSIVKEPGESAKPA